MENTMRTAGISARVVPESTIEYYRVIIESYRRQDGTCAYPPVVINSIDTKRMLDYGSL